MLSESQNIEYKESWNDKYLQWICGFANAQGGRIYIGIVGVHDAKKLMRKMGHSWDDMPLPTATLEEIDRSSIDYFLRRGISRGRIDPSEKEASTEDVLRNMNLIGEDGFLRAAAILLFGKNPQRRFAGVQFKIGRFGVNESDLIIQDVVEGNVIQMVDRVVEVLKSKYLYSPIHYEGMERVEPLEIPEDGLREILYNSVCHKEYMGAPIQMQVYSDHVEIWNEGGLPDGYTAETLMRKHSSRPRNKTIAAVMFRAGFIETWGRGYTKVRESFEADDYPMPVVTEIDGGVSVWIKRFSLDELAARNKKRYGDKAPNLQGTIMGDVGVNVGLNTEKYPINDESTLQKYPINTEKYPINGESTLQKYPINDLDDKNLGNTEIRILEIVAKNPNITREQLSEEIGITLEGPKKQLKKLREQGLLVREGSRKTGYWRIITNDNE